MNSVILPRMSQLEVTAKSIDLNGDDVLLNFSDQSSGLQFTITYGELIQVVGHAERAMIEFRKLHRKRKRNRGIEEGWLKL